MTKTTTKSRRAVGTLGVAAVAAILLVSVAVANFGGQQAIAIHGENGNEPLAAKKGAVSMSGHVPVGVAEDWLTTQTLQDNPNFGQDEVLATLWLKGNEGGDWIADMSADCAVMTHIEGKGDMVDLEGAYAGAKVSFWLDDQPVSVITGTTLALEEDGSTPYDAQWNFCLQIFEIETTLNAFISTCGDLIALHFEGIDPDFTGCTFTIIEDEDGNFVPVADDPFKLIFLCDALTEAYILAHPEIDCEQAVRLYLENAGAYNVKVLLKDLDSQVHHKLEVRAEYDAGSSSLEGKKKGGGDSRIDSVALIGKRILVAEPIHLVATQG